MINKIVEKFKGFKTVLIGAVPVLVGLVKVVFPDAPVPGVTEEQVSAVITQAEGAVMTLYGMAIIALRFVTDTAIFKKK